VLAVALLAVGALLAALGALLGQAVAARHRAQAAADLAALAAASAWPLPDCGRATRTAAVNGAGVDGCRVAADGSVTVVVAVPLPPPLGALGPARAVARAGQPAVPGPAVTGPEPPGGRVGS
jgi:secretion/DNA translocation related TadE-like protein